MFNGFLAEWCNLVVHTRLVTIAINYLSYSFIIGVVLGIDAAIIDIINERSVKDMV